MAPDVFVRRARPLDAVASSRLNNSFANEGLMLLRTPEMKQAVAAFIDGLDLFGIGASWGGYESLIQPSFPERGRTATRWQAEGPLVRIHIKTQAVQTLIDDMI